MKILVYFLVIITGCTMSTKDRIIGHGKTNKIVSAKDSTIIYMVSLFEKPSGSIFPFDSIPGNIEVVILEETDDYFLVESKTLNKKGYVLKGYVEIKSENE